MRALGRKPRIGILISGRGSNMLAILKRIASGRMRAEAAVVVSNEPGAPGLRAARRMGVETLVFDHRDSETREAHDRLVSEALAARHVDLICLAGYERLLSPGFVRRFRGRILNIHPSLLPAFPGTDVHRRVLEHGVKVSGLTVHFVDEGVDSGPIILQEAVPVRDGDTPETLAARILGKEHRAYGRAVALALSGRLRLEGRRVVVARSRTASAGGRAAKAAVARGR